MWAEYAFGFALCGFFNGILPHQILQWHHLLSGIEEARQSIRVLILADGLFHALMYLIAMVGVWLLWRSRGAFALGGADRMLFANALIGFGAWHVVDGVLYHWILGIHRIRMDVENQLFGDLLWLAVFGLVPIAAGVLMRRSGGAAGRRNSSVPVLLVMAALSAGAFSAIPAPGDGTVMIVFRSGTTSAQAM